MPNESGPAYAAPPAPPGAEVPGEERIRSIEDYLSKRIKAKVFMTNNGADILNNNGGYIVWDTMEYDTATLWDGGDEFVIPDGAEGDYLFIASAGWNTYGNHVLTIEHNGQEMSGARVGNDGSDYSLTTWGFMRPGDSVRVWVFNGSGSTAHVVGALTFATPTSFTAVRMI